MGLYARKPKLRYHSYKGEVGKVAPNILQQRTHQTKIENEPGTIPNSLSKSSQIDLIICPTFWGHLSVY